MSNNIISIFGSKIFLEILEEIKTFTKFKFKYYESLDQCLQKNEEKLIVLFINEKNRSPI